MPWPDNNSHLHLRIVLKSRESEKENTFPVKSTYSVCGYTSNTGKANTHAPSRVYCVMLWIVISDAGFSNCAELYNLESYFSCNFACNFACNNTNFFFVVTCIQ